MHEAKHKQTFFVLFHLMLLPAGAGGSKGLGWGACTVLTSKRHPKIEADKTNGLEVNV